MALLQRVLGFQENWKKGSNGRKSEGKPVIITYPPNLIRVFTNLEKLLALSSSASVTASHEIPKLRCDSKHFPDK